MNKGTRCHLWKNENSPLGLGNLLHWTSIAQVNGSAAELGSRRVSKVRPFHGFASVNAVALVLWGSIRSLKRVLEPQPHQYSI